MVAAAGCTLSRRRRHSRVYKRSITHVPKCASGSSSVLPTGEKSYHKSAKLRFTYRTSCSTWPRETTVLQKMERNPYYISVPCLLNGNCHVILVLPNAIMYTTWHGNTSWSSSQLKSKGDRCWRWFGPTSPHSSSMQYSQNTIQCIYTTHR